MATCDAELGVRVAVIKVLGAVDGHALLEDEEREKLCLLVFDEEQRVRKAVSGFVKGIWQDSVDDRLVGQKLTSEEQERVGVKVLASLLVKWSKSLESRSAEAEEIGSSGDDDQNAGQAKAMRAKGAAASAAARQKGRTALAVEALWDELDIVSSWEILLDVLQLDHSSNQTGTGRGRKAKNAASSSAVIEAYRLEDVEENILLEVLVAVLRRMKIPAPGAKKVCRCVLCSTKISA